MVTGLTAVETGELLLDWNESPLGPPPVAVRRLIETAAQLSERPVGLAAAVTDLAAAHLGVTTRQVLLTSGVDEALDLAMTLADRGWALDPGFDFRARIEPCGKQFAPIAVDDDWQPVEVADRLGPRDALFIAQPGNPMGNLTDPAWIERHRVRCGLFFLDETYQGFSGARSVLERGIEDDRTLVYRSFAKSFGLAGLRVGCLVGHPDLIARLAPARRDAPIDAINLHAAAAVLEDPGFAATLTSFVVAGRPRLAALLRDCGLFAEVRDTETNFVIARPAAGPADAFAELLAGQGVRVKPCGYFGLPEWIRVGVPDEDGLNRLAQALDRVRQGASSAAP